MISVEAVAGCGGALIDLLNGGDHSGLRCHCRLPMDSDSMIA